MIKRNVKSILLSLMTVISLSAVGQPHSGKVYVDLNQNGRPDPGEKTLKGILVTDGLNVVKTDESGGFRLPERTGATMIYISMPSGYQSKSFYYPLEGKRKSFDFGLQPYSFDTSAGFSFVQITDTETPEYGPWIDNLKDYMRLNHPAFVIHTGDICYEPGLKFHAKAINSQTMGGPVHYSIGNHDLVKGKYGDALYQQLFGPPFYSFDVAGTHFVVLPMLSGDNKPSYTKKDVLDWLKNDLNHTPTDRRLVVLTHDLLTSVDNKLLAEEGKFIYGVGKDDFIDLNKHHLLLWVYGHWHDDFVKKYKTGVITACGSTPDKGGIVHSLSSFRVFTISKEGKLSIETRYTHVNRQAVVAAPATYQMLNANGEIPISINAYHSASPIVSIDYKMDKDSKQDWGNVTKNEWKPLQQVTSWNWRGVFSPARESIGKVGHMEVRVTLKDGSRFYTQQFFTVQANRQIGLGEDWPQLLKNSTLSGGMDNIKGKDANLKFPLQLVWTANAGGPVYMCAPIVAEGKLFVASRDEGNFDQCFVSAFDAVSGKQLWQYKTMSSVKGAIAYRNGSVVATDDDGNVYNILAKDGTLKWKTALGMPDMPAYIPGVLIDGDKIYTGEGEFLAAIELATGKLLWKGGGWSRGNGSTAAHSLAGDILVSSSQWSGLFGNDIHSGRLIWSQDKEGLRFRSSPAVYVSGKLYTSSEHKIFRLDATTGQIEKSIVTPFNLEVSGRPLIHGNTVIVATADGGVAAFDFSSGTLLWSFLTGPALTYASPYTQKRVRTVEASPVLKGNSVLFGGMDGKFYAVNVTTGACEWSTDLGSPVLASLAISGEMIYVADYGGSVYAFKEITDH